jgi:hypothetical protein
MLLYPPIGDCSLGQRLVEKWPPEDRHDGYKTLETERCQFVPASTEITVLVVRFIHGL